MRPTSYNDLRTILLRAIDVDRFRRLSAEMFLHPDIDLALFYEMVALVAGLEDESCKCRRSQRLRKVCQGRYHVLRSGLPQFVIARWPISCAVRTREACPLLKSVTLSRVFRQAHAEGEWPGECWNRLPQIGGNHRIDLV